MGIRTTQGAVRRQDAGGSGSLEPGLGMCISPKHQGEWTLLGEGPHFEEHGSRVLAHWSCRETEARG